MEIEPCPSCGGTGVHRSLLSSAWCWTCGGTGKSKMIFPTGCPSEGTQGEPQLVLDPKGLPKLVEALRRLLVTEGNPFLSRLDRERFAGADAALKEVLGP